MIPDQNEKLAEIFTFLCSPDLYWRMVLGGRNRAVDRGSGVRDRGRRWGIDGWGVTKTIEKGMELISSPCFHHPCTITFVAVYWSHPIPELSISFPSNLLLYVLIVSQHTLDLFLHLFHQVFVSGSKCFFFVQHNLDSTGNPGFVGGLV